MVSKTIVNTHLYVVWMAGTWPHGESNQCDPLLPVCQINEMQFSALWTMRDGAYTCLVSLASVSPLIYTGHWILLWLGFHFDKAIGENPA